MEDPKHWGIQCIVEKGYEIQDGKLTGKVVAPVVLTGYVPDMLEFLFVDFAVFNVADACLVIGCGLAVLDLFREGKHG